MRMPCDKFVLNVTHKLIFFTALSFVFGEPEILAFAICPTWLFAAFISHV